jgi:two-component system phosphate regulon sensor histidine kinase PhoR
VTIRRRLLAVLVLAIGVCTLGVDAAGRLFIEPPLRSLEIERLVRETTLLARQLERSWPESVREADRWADRTAEGLGVRISLIAAEGNLIGDSQLAIGDFPQAESHADRPEVRSALTRAHGEDRRLSHTLGREMHYVAARVGPRESPLGVVRAAVEAGELGAAPRRLRRTVTGIALAGFVILAAIILTAARRMTRSIATIARAAESVTVGRLETRVQASGPDDIVRLASALEGMRRALADRVRHAESEQRLLSAILGGLREGILVVTTDRRVLLVNASLRRSLNLPSSVGEGTPLIQAVWDRDVVETFDEALSRGDEVRRRVTLPDGVAFELTVVPFEDAGRGPGAIGLFFSISRLEALERVRRDFVADISHELRTPLASVKAAAETLQGGAIEDRREAAVFLGILAKNTHRMEAILNDLTDLSLIETGAIHLSPEAVELGSAVREAAAAVATRASAKQVSLKSVVPAGLLLQADRRRLDQVLLNLLDNAVKFNRAGGAVTVTAEPVDGMVRVVIDDTGPGIPPDALDRIFNRFYRLDRARSQDVPGTGLGLAIVKHLVRLQGGEIRAENNPGTGARFILELPSAGQASVDSTKN